jgi:plastocyanin
MRKTKYLILLTLFIGIFTLTGCNNSNKTDSNNTNNEVQSGDVKISLENFAFSPKEITIKTGTKVIWTNNDSTSHTIISDDGTFSSSTLKTNGTFEFTFNTKGTFSYHCSIHPSMTGKIIVE